MLSAVASSMKGVKKFKYLEGTYKRTKIFEKDHSKLTDNVYNDLTEIYETENVNSECTLNYLQ